MKHPASKRVIVIKNDTKDVPRRSTSGGGGSSDDDDDSTGRKDESKVKITILQPEWIRPKQKTKVYIKVDYPKKVQKIEATTDLIKQWQDITKTGYYELSKDAKVLVKVTDKQGVVTTKRRNIRCYDDTLPTVSAVQEGMVARITGTDDLSGISKLYVNGEIYTEDALQDGLLLYDIPLGTQSLVVQSEDAACNPSRELTLELNTALIQSPAPPAVVTPINPVPAPDAELEKLVAQLKAENEKLQKENKQLRQTVQKQKETITQLKVSKVTAPDTSVTAAPQQTKPPTVPAVSSSITSPSTTNMPRVAVIAAAILCFAALMTTIILVARRRKQNYAYND
ncbi:bZIP transcription factor [Oscillospiraceae bacterium PP1C4]